MSRVRISILGCTATRRVPCPLSCSRPRSDTPLLTRPTYTHNRCLPPFTYSLKHLPHLIPFTISISPTADSLNIRTWAASYSATIPLSGVLGVVVWAGSSEVVPSWLQGDTQLKLTSFQRTASRREGSSYPNIVPAGFTEDKKIARVCFIFIVFIYVCWGVRSSILAWGIYIYIYVWVFLFSSFLFLCFDARLVVYSSW